MRKLPILFTLMLSAAMAHAQFHIPANPARFMVLLAPKVREHLKVTDKQYDKIKDILDGVVSDDGKGHISVQFHGDSKSEELEKDVLAVLDKKQSTRFEELYLQKAGLLTAVQKPVADKLALTDDQRKKVDEIAESFQEKLMDMFTSNEGGGIAIRMDMQKAESVRKEFNGKVESLLTSDQKAKWKSMLGEKFDFTEKEG